MTLPSLIATPGDFFYIHNGCIFKDQLLAASSYLVQIIQLIDLQQMSLIAALMFEVDGIKVTLE